MRFQPRVGQLLAAASDKVVSIFDVETDRQTNLFQVRDAWLLTSISSGRLTDTTYSS